MRLLGVEWEAESETSLQASITKLKSCVGMDAAGQNTPTAVVTGRVSVSSISPELLTEINDSFPQLVVVADGEPQYIVRYVDWDNTLLYRAVVSAGSAAPNPVTSGQLEAPTREGTEDTHYAFRDFGTLPQAVSKNESVVAQYDTQYRVRFMNGEAVFDTQWVIVGGSATAPSGTPTKASTAQYSYTFSGWQGSYQGITGPVDIEAKFTSTVRKYTVTFYNGSTLLQTVNDVPYGGSASYTGTTPVSPDGSATDYPFEGWNPQPTNITGTTKCMAVFGSPLEVKEIEDSWDDILAACADGTYKQKYKIGNYKPLDLGSEGVINMQIAGREVDALADGSGMAPLSWVGIELLQTSRRVNPSLIGKVAETKYVGGIYKMTAVEGVEYKYQSTNQKKHSTDSQGLWIITPFADGTVTLAWTVDSEGTDRLNIFIDDEPKLSGKGGTNQSGSIAVDGVANTPFTVFASYKKDGSVDTGTDTATVMFSSEVGFTISEGEENTVIKPGVPAQEGTGSIGGWEKSELRTYYYDTLLPLIPENVRTHLKTVLKNQPAYDTDEKNYTQTTEEKVCPPSYTELFGSASTTNQPRYKALFPDNASRVKKKAGAASAVSWRLRSANNICNFYNVQSSGSYSTYGASSVLALPLCFFT